MKKSTKKNIILMFVVVVVIALAIVGVQYYRYNSITHCFGENSDMTFCQFLLL